MKKLNTFSYILGVVMVLASCQSGETRRIMQAADPQEPIHDVTSTKLEQTAQDQRSGMSTGFGWVSGNAVFTTKPIADTSGNPGDEVISVVYAGGTSRSDGNVLKDTIACGQEFIDVAFQPAGEPTESDLSTNDSISKKTIANFNGTDGQVLTLEDLYRYLKVESTLPTPHYEPSSTVTGVRYEPGRDENTRIVWVAVTVNQQVIGTSIGTNLTQAYEIGYIQTKAATVEPEEPYEIRLHNFDLYRTYRKKTQHSICEGFMSFAVYNSKTGELVEEISTDGFSSQLAKCGHFGAPTNGYIIREASLLGNAPTSVTENVVSDNAEALSASYIKGNFKLTVKCISQDYYVHFPVRGRDDAEGGIAAGGQNLFFTATCVYTNPETGWTKTWEFTHKTEVNIKGWQQRTPQVDRTSETVNDVDGERKLRYAGTYVVEFVNHLYLNGEEIVQENGNEDYYFQSSKINGDTSPFHTSDMAIDCWTSYLP